MLEKVSSARCLLRLASTSTFNEGCNSFFFERFLDIYSFLYNHNYVQIGDGQLSLHTLMPFGSIVSSNIVQHNQHA